MTRPRALLVFTLLLTTACHTNAPVLGLRTFGGMREVMRQGHDQGRVHLSSLGTKGAIGVGALAGLAGEVTIVDGAVLVATVTDNVCTVREAQTSDQATLLVVEDIAAWQDYELGACASYEDLEQRIAKLLQQLGRDLTVPTAVRVRGMVQRLQVHVIAGACPIANPDGPSPWRYDGPANDVQLVGFYVEGAAGRLTHHNHQSHLHAISDRAMGHLDDVVFTNATLSLPRRMP